jgi:polysaccharide export outer membrane protein
MTRAKNLGALVLVGVMATATWAQATNQNNNSTNSAPPATAPASSTPASVAVDPNTYVIGAEDALHVSVWKEGELTATVPVRPDGMISLPLLNDVQAAGLTPMQLAASITEKFKKYVSDPRVTVVVTAMNSRRVYVLGEVNHNGPMGMTPNMTILQALAQAGFSQFANTKGIYVLRVENGKQQKLPFNYKKVIKGESMDQNIVLKPGDTIVVP